MDNYPELEEQTEWSPSSSWGTISHSTPGPVPCLPRLIFHSLAEHSHGPFLFVSSPMRCHWLGLCPAAQPDCRKTRGWCSEPQMQGGSPHSPNSFTSTMWSSFCLDWHQQVRTASLGMLQHLWLVNRLPPPPGTLVLPPAQALDQHYEVPGSFSSWTGLRFMKNHQTHDNLNAVFWTVQW